MAVREEVQTALHELRKNLRSIFERRHADAEEMIRRCLMVLLQSNSRISGVSKGRGLEQRVMELTV